MFCLLFSFIGPLCFDGTVSQTVKCSYGGSSLKFAGFSLNVAIPPWPKVKKGSWAGAGPALPEINQAAGMVPPPVASEGPARLWPAKKDFLLFGQKLAHERFLFLQFVYGGVNPGAAELIDGQTLDNFQLLPVAADGKRTDKPPLDAISSR